MLTILVSSMILINAITLFANNAEIIALSLLARYFFVASTAALFFTYYFILHSRKHTRFSLYLPITYAISSNLIFYYFIPKQYFLFSQTSETLLLSSPKYMQNLLSLNGLTLEHLLKIREDSIILFALILFAYFLAATSMLKFTKISIWRQLNFFTTSSLVVLYLLATPVAIKYLIKPSSSNIQESASLAWILFLGFLVFSIFTKFLTVKMEKLK